MCAVFVVELKHCLSQGRYGSDRRTGYPSGLKDTLKNVLQTDCQHTFNERRDMKPSERIAEIFDLLAMQRLQVIPRADAINFIGLKLDAIIQYLDEQGREKQRRIYRERKVS